MIVNPMNEKVYFLFFPKYKRVIQKTQCFFSISKNKVVIQFMQSQPTHIRHIRLTGDMNNNQMKRLNGEFRDREKYAGD